MNDFDQFDFDDLDGVDVFHFEAEAMNFNDISRENGFTYWFARDFMKMLGYETYEAFWKVINKAIATCMTLDIDTSENFEQVKREVDGQEVKDYKLSRFACYLIAMQADGKKPKVAQAQAFFAASAEAIRKYIDSAEDVERVSIREDLSTHEKSLVSTAKQADVTDFGLFHNAGYRGMYNMNLSKLKEYKGLEDKKRSLLDFMRGEELGANIFRITQTDAKLRREKIEGQKNAENVAQDVGRMVRETIIKINGTPPEDMELGQDIRTIKSGLKATYKGLKKIDE